MNNNLQAANKLTLDHISTHAGLTYFVETNAFGILIFRENFDLEMLCMKCKNQQLLMFCVQVTDFKESITKEAEKLIEEFFPRKCIELDQLLKVAKII